jgi:hypothetical protein
MSSDEVNHAVQSLKFAKAKVFHSTDNDQNAPFWTGKIEVIFRGIIPAGRSHDSTKFDDSWDGGDVGFVIGQADPKMKGVMTKKGNHQESRKVDGMMDEVRNGGLLETITMNHCSTVGLMFAGVLGPMNPMIMARQADKKKRGSDQVAADLASSVRPTKIRVMQEIRV